MPEHILAGCRPVPLAGYLKALAVLRLVGEQADRTARGYWRDDVFVLQTSLDRERLLEFFLNDYAPTPIVAPWNGGSGFYEKGNRTAYQAMQAILGSATLRLSAYRSVILTGLKILKDFGIVEMFREDPRKALLLTACRSRFPDSALPWLDAALVLAEKRPQFPRLLGTGGNDGRLDFTNNFMQRIVDILDPETGSATSESSRLIESSLFETATDQLGTGKIGMFSPHQAGGANAGTGFGGKSQANPWDFVLMLEGAVLFAAAAVWRMGQDSSGTLSYPFTVRPTVAGYASATDADKANSQEMWLPLWGQPVVLSEIHALLAEGRARVSGRTARNGIDFARAVATLGVDRGIEELQRYGLQVRNGLSYFATPLERFRVREQESTRLLDGIDAWLTTFRRRATASHTPGSVQRSLRLLEESILDLCRRGGPDRVQRVLVALGNCEKVLGRSLGWTIDSTKSRLTPVPPLPVEWVREADDGSTEFRLAMSLASLWAKCGGQYAPFREHLEPVRGHHRAGSLRVEWNPEAGRDVAWTEGALVPALNSILSRRLVMFARWGVGSFPDQGAYPSRASDITDFLELRVDDDKIAALLWGAILIDWPDYAHRSCIRDEHQLTPPALYSILKLCLAGNERDSSLGHIPITPRLHRLAASGDGTSASRVAIQRLRASGLRPAVPLIHQQGEAVQRIAAGLLLPPDRDTIGLLQRTILRPHPGDSMP